MPDERSYKEKRRRPYPNTLPPRHPKAEVRRNYSSINAPLRYPRNHGGIEASSLFMEWHRNFSTGEVDYERLNLAQRVSSDLPSFISLGISNIKENSPMRNKILKSNEQILRWLDEWVTPEESRGVRRDIPIFSQVKKLVAAEAEKYQNEPTRERKHIQTWWENLKFLRFLLAKGSIGSAMLNRQNGVDVTSIMADIFSNIDLSGIESEKLLARILKLSQGPDLDFSIFPTDIFQEVFDEFQREHILEKALEPKTQTMEVVGDEKEKFIVGELMKEDVRLPSGFRLASNNLYCAFSTGNIPQKHSIQYFDIVYYVNVVNERTGNPMRYKISALEFMPSTIDESTVDEDSRTGWTSGLLSQIRASGVYLVNREKLNDPVWLTTEDDKIKRESGFVVKLENVFAEALCLPDMPVGPHLYDMANGDVEFDNNLVATLVGRAIRDGFFNLLNISTENDHYGSMYTGDHEQLFKRLLKRFKPEKVKLTNYEEMQLGLMQAWILDFPRLIGYLKYHGFAKHTVAGQNEKIFQAFEEIADNVSTKYKNSDLLKLLRKAKQSGDKTGIPAKIESEDLRNLIDRNLTKVMELIRLDKRIPDFIKQGKSDLELMSEFLAMPIFRELSREKAWGADLEVKVLDGHNFRQHLLAESEAISKPIFGYRYYEAGDTFIYHMSRYPRKLKYRVGSSDEYQKVASDIATVMKLEEPIIDRPISNKRFRIVLGLNEGYSKERKVSTAEIENFLGERFVFKSGQIITVNNIPLFSNPFYQEDAIIIEGNIEDIDQVFQLADLTGQERFAVELLDLQEAYMVETRHCQMSDLEFKPEVRTEEMIIEDLARLSEPNSS